MNVILYTRVSTDEQAQGNSLDYQESFLRSYCQVNKHNIIDIYKEDASAKDFERRPEMQKMMVYCRKHRKDVDLILFTRWDRYSRNLEAALSNIHYFDNLGIQVNSAENPIDISIPDNKVMLALYLTMPEVENSKIAKRTKECIHQARLAGRCTNKAPKGYLNKQIDEKHRYVEIDEKEASKIRAIFKEVSEGLKAPNYIRQQWARKGFTMSKNSFMDMLRNRFYCGEIVVPAYLKDEEQIVKGIHEPIIDMDTFNKVQEVLNGKQKVYPKVSRKLHPDLFLRKYLVCPTCGSPLTGSASKGNGGRYFYYHCSKDGKHFRCRAEMANQEFAKYVSSLVPNESILQLYSEILNDIRSKDNKGTKDIIKNIKEELSMHQKRIEAIEDKYLDGEIDKNEYNRFMKRLSDKAKEIEQRLDIAENAKRLNLEPKLNYSMALINSIDKYILDCPVEVKCKLIGSMFKGKIEFDGKNYRTTEYNKVLDLIYQQTNQLRGKEKGQIQNNLNLSCSVPRPAFEIIKVGKM